MGVLQITFAILIALPLVALARPVDIDQATLVGFNSHALNTELALAKPQLAFDLWLKFWNKKYINDLKERSKRLPIFQKNSALIHQHNSQPSSSFKMALNEFADLTFEEFAAVRLGYNTSLASSKTLSNDAKLASFSYADVNEKDIPASIDWREKGAVSPVKNQLACGSCWAFSTTGSIEGINAIKTGNLVSLSEQQLVDCDRKEDMGCSGGLMDNAFEYILKNGGIDTEEDYGYWSFDLPCQHRREHDRPAVTIDGYEDVPVNDPVALKKALSNQPIAVAICANSGLQFYSSGVFSEKSCCTELNHGVLAVGYVEEDDGNAAEEPHWIVKNSWGSSWGESGFFRLQMDAKRPEGSCGIYEAASYPVKNSNTNPEVPEICGIFGWTECPLHQSCGCNFSLFGLFCFSWGCQ